MRTYFKIVYCLAIVLCAAACDMHSINHTKEDPDFLNDVNELMKRLPPQACNKKDSELTISDAARASKVTFSGRIENKDIEDVDCDGKVLKSHGPVKHFEDYLLLNAPQNIKEPVNFVKVENPRTCLETSFDTIEKLSYPDKTDENGSQAQTPIISSTADSTGKTVLSLADYGYFLLSNINVKDGLNPIKISYYGKCLKKKENPDPKATSRYDLCEEAELLATREVLVDLQIERPEGVGTKRNDVCYKK